MVDKEISTFFKGYLYPSGQVARCPRYHRCLITQKCQSYDAHNLECAVCETRVQPARHLGGYVAEGKYIPDLQDAIQTIENTIRVSFAHRDAAGQKMDSGVEITQKHNRFRKASEMIQMFMDHGIWKLDESFHNVWYDKDKKQFLGRLE